MCPILHIPSWLAKIGFQSLQDQLSGFQFVCEQLISGTTSPIASKLCTHISWMTLYFTGVFWLSMFSFVILCYTHCPQNNKFIHTYYNTNTFHTWWRPVLWRVLFLVYFCHYFYYEIDDDRLESQQGRITHINVLKCTMAIIWWQCIVMFLSFSVLCGPQED